MHNNTTIPTLVNSIKLDEMEIKTFHTQGYLIISELINSITVESLRKEVIQNVNLAFGNLPSKLSQTNQYLKGSLTDSLVNSPEILKMAEQLLKGPSTLHSPFTAVKTARVGGEFHFHQDNQYTFLDGPALNFWIALNNMTPENGTLAICPGSHKSGTLDAQQSPDNDEHQTITYKIEEYLPIRIRAGDCVVFDRLMVHGSGKNQTDQDRVAFALQYHRNDVKARRRGETNFFLLKDKPLCNTKPVQAIKPREEPKAV
jgi:2-oxoglutarate-dependent dioxygenase